MKNELLLSILSTLLLFGGCTLEEIVEKGLDCPPKMFAFDMDALGNKGKPYLCMLDNNDISIDGIPNCIPCDFKMHPISDGKFIYLSKNNNGDYMYLNEDDSEKNIDRKYLSEDTKYYVVNKYSDYKKYTKLMNGAEMELYAINGVCAKDEMNTKSIFYANCKEKCGNNPASCNDECKNIIKCFSMKEYFVNKICPIEIPICSFGKYKSEKINNYYCTSNVECMPDTVNADCPKKITNWNTGRCENNICIVDECKHNYKPANDHKSCVSDCRTGQHYDSRIQTCTDDSIYNCDETGKNCTTAVSHWIDGTCENRKCIVNKCDEGYIVVDNECVLNCELGTHHDVESDSCVPDDPDNCGATGKSCYVEIKNSSEVNCELGKCNVVKCDSGFIVRENLCVSSCTNTQYYDNDSGNCVNSNTSNCGQKGYDCSKNIDQWASGSCDSNSCILKNCNKGYKVVDNVCKSDCKSNQHYDSNKAACVQDDDDNCGAEGRSCSAEIKHSLYTYCSYGECKVDMCKNGYVKHTAVPQKCGFIVGSELIPC